MKSVNLTEEEGGDIDCICSLLARHEMRHFGKAIHNDEDGVEALLGAWQT